MGSSLLVMARVTATYNTYSPPRHSTWEEGREACHFGRDRVNGGSIHVFNNKSASSQRLIFRDWGLSEGIRRSEPPVNKEADLSTVC